jgi:iturin family lipopeptide synthetase A
MYAGIYEQEPFFKEIVDECCVIVNKLIGADLLSIIFDQNKLDGYVRLDDTQYTQPSLFIMEYAIARLFMNFGVEPQMMIGHSIGEYVAACLSEVFSLEDALNLVVKRGKLMQQTPAGSMLNISISEDKLQIFLKNNIGLSLAAVNGSESCVVSGNDSDIAGLKAEVEKHGYETKIIRTSRAYHSYLMDEILDEFGKEVSKIKLNKPNIPFISNLSGEAVNGNEIIQPSYWVDHLRQTVKFAKGIEVLLKKGARTIY